MLARGRDAMRIVFIEGCLIGRAAGNIMGKQLMARGRNIVRIGQAAGSIMRKELLVRGRNTMRIVSIEGYQIG